MNPMNETSLLMSVAALAGLSSCSMEPCLSRSFPSALPTCRSCAQSGQHSGTAIHLGTPADHADVCPAAADAEVVYRVRPGT